MARVKGGEGVDDADNWFAEGFFREAKSLDEDLAEEEGEVRVTIAG